MNAWRTVAVPGIRFLFQLSRSYYGRIPAWLLQQNEKGPNKHIRTTSRELCYVRNCPIARNVIRPIISREGFVESFRDFIAFLEMLGNIALKICHGSEATWET